MAYTLAKDESPAAKDRVDAFLTTSHDLLSLVEHENAILLEDGALSFEAYIMRKVTLMNRFEEEARALLSLASEERAPASMREILVSEVTRIREAISINSAFQVRSLIQTRRERLALSGQKSREEGGETKCH